MTDRTQSRFFSRNRKARRDAMLRRLAAMRAAKARKRLANFQERDFKVAINRRTRNGVRAEIYLDEIEPGEPKGADPQISCGLFCMAEHDALDGGSNNQIGQTDDTEQG